jgi:hypothetical protein
MRKNRGCVSSQLKGRSKYLHPNFFNHSHMRRLRMWSYCEAVIKMCKKLDKMVNVASRRQNTVFSAFCGKLFLPVTILKGIWEWDVWSLIFAPIKPCLRKCSVKQKPAVPYLATNISTNWKRMLEIDGMTQLTCRENVLTLFSLNL